ncbi:UDP-N-acetylmuramate--alanine ligase [Buchnera aphidicola (Diuraphis noxia)]|uniref:UDP-N-acetylmuramate--L-alanine ligase n=2 Tax=Buchnera aphidicola TaxID=9 RepID=A0A1B2H884_BUCDN|nr:UDP-N-acetylmuramate--L-alanine ligase [Buchnera aphidicola]ABZ89703.1 UDP-N-acetylmuramate--L-alanine ligase [Buchnera aphidicola]ANZ22441.1 UDP-N-acetylmuramate--alanine ligase [Buchnera aphidicola (Diuraphis noxia)]
MNVNDIKNINFFVYNKKKIKNIHFIGIGGTGMGGIALILLKLGYNISGSDLLKNAVTDTLINLGANIYFKHSKKNIKNSDFVIKSSAVLSNNPEITSAKKYNIPILLRAEMLQILMKFKTGIAISGTHGKTTTTSMITDICIRSRLNPTCINGGLIKSINSYATLGSSRYFIVEADESDASFLYLNPTIAIVTNIESDHMDHYNSLQQLIETFLKFLKKIPIHGIAIICIDNFPIPNIFSKIKCQIITYGFNKNADIRILCYRQHSFLGFFSLIVNKKIKLSIKLNIPGKHNALNAAAAVAFSLSQGLKTEDIIKTLKNFQGTARRFEYLGYLSITKDNINNKNSILIDDYGHHPTELSETIKTIRTSWPKKNLIMIFQPHRYTRTYNLYYEFIKVLVTVDTLLILNVYSANEKFISGANSYSLYQDIKKSGKIDITLISNNNFIMTTLLSKVTGNDVILIQGAGNIDTIMKKILIYQ